MECTGLHRLFSAALRTPSQHASAHTTHPAWHSDSGFWGAQAWEELVAPDATEREWHSIEAEHSAAQVAVAELEAKLAEGQTDAMRAKHGQCVSTKLGSYTYKLCFFDKVQQQEGHRWNDMGTFPPRDETVVRPPPPTQNQHRSTSNS